MTYESREGANLASAAADLRAYRVAETATEALRWVIERAPVTPHEGAGDPPAAYWRAKALLYLSVLAVRATRAAMAVLAAGYEAEAMTYKRTLMEVHSRARRISEDKSGSYAREWLRGRAGKPAKAVGAFSPDDFWDMLSHSSHADHRAVENFLAISNEDGTTSLLTGPERRVAVSNATLATFAGECRDVAVLLAKEHDLAIPGLAEMDKAISQHFPWAEGAGPGA